MSDGNWKRYVGIGLLGFLLGAGYVGVCMKERFKPVKAYETFLQGSTEELGTTNEGYRNIVVVDRFGGETVVPLKTKDRPEQPSELETVER
jgi:hypothetical protein